MGIPLKPNSDRDTSWIDHMVQLCWICRRMFSCANYRRAQNIEEIAWEYNYWRRKMTFQTLPSATAVLAQCSEPRAEEAGIIFLAPTGLQRMGKLLLFRNTHQVVEAQYHHFSASGYLRHHVSGTQTNIWNEFRKICGYTPLGMCDHLNCTRGTPSAG